VSFESPALRFVHLLPAGEEHLLDRARADALLSVEAESFPGADAAECAVSVVLKVEDAIGMAAVVVLPRENQSDEDVSMPGPRVEMLVRLHYAGLVLAEQQWQAELSPMSSDFSEVRSLPLFQRIFASYEREDTCVVECVGSVVRSLGVGELRWDLEILEAGDDWQTCLSQEIEKADSFQLFWSQHAKRSRNVRAEWKHALSLKRERFVKPGAFPPSVPSSCGGWKTTSTCMPSPMTSDILWSVLMKSSTKWSAKPASHCQSPKPAAAVRL
jgi:hypothetical protein